MKRVPIGLLAAVLLLRFHAVNAQDMSSYRKNAEATVKAKNPAWKLITRQSRDKEITYQWGQEKADVTLKVFNGASAKEATDRMKRALDSLSVGPGEAISRFGDEAYLWKSEGNGFAGIRFRRGNVYIDISGPSVAIVEDIAKDLAKLK